MRVVEILQSKPSTTYIDKITTRINGYAEKLLEPGISSAGKELLKRKIQSEIAQLNSILKERYGLTEAIHELPVTDDDFKRLKLVLNHPIPATIAGMYLHNIINDDQLNAEIADLEQRDPGQDVRPLVVAWIKRVMPDQLYRFGQKPQDPTSKRGMLSPIHGYDPGVNKGTGTGSSGDAYGFY